MGKQLNSASADQLLGRIDKLQPGSTAAWGRLTVAGMMYHHIMVTREILQAKENAKKPTAKQKIFKIVGLYLMRQFPKGVKSADKYFCQHAGLLDFAREKSKLIEIVKYAAAYDQPIYGKHPFFGPMRTKSWKRFLYKHLD